VIVGIIANILQKALVTTHSIMTETETQTVPTAIVMVLHALLDVLGSGVVRARVEVVQITLLQMKQVMGEVLVGIVLTTTEIAI
jgi:hypothetical protein